MMAFDECSAPAVTVVQEGASEEETLKPADALATAQEVRAAMSSCVVHLCGCN